MGKVFELEIETTNKEEIIDITSEIEYIVEQRDIEEGMICLYVPHTSAAVTIHRKLDDPKKPRLPELLEKVNPEEEASPYTKAALVAPTEILVVKDRKVILGSNQRIYLYEFNGPKKRRMFMYISD
ncbi:MAG: secondary thiamine-phosphate synthase enzyme YjbQ [Caldimicrobium sp.]|nr:secondary thiamine-phosphate synthase enzyme YjbQ [Caldimicrobium sp.]MCX7613173.1 secondary thiamine-phosphate synthase enzyme YjbQ [Caldimicrobium sp.]MDW8182525.1 secondary thiamine-phosphate synthase enzyme YjbQ [Caldimicrobium sp.]